ncbi:MAG: ADP-forming succinate--CoA ligase subunit beta [Simkaniaceae bacterium]|nr:ADP-forming succinate--CoA ligase subunit beta [Simkaniaceae bacterium]
MNTHEYQAKEVLKKYGVPIPAFGVASSAEEARHVVDRLQLKKGVVKIQVHAGGRGKAGGVKFGKTKEEIVEIAGQLIGMKMVNNQTGAKGVIAHQVLISEPVDIDKEFYLGAIMDREGAQPILIASPEGGMEIEEVAAQFPEKILKLPIRLDGTVRSFHLLRLAKFMGWEGKARKQGMQIAAAVAKAFMDVDGSLLEINPLVLSKEGDIWALDAKLSIDDNALFRHSEIASYYDPTQVSPNEVEANKYELAYVSLEGNIGCMVNGAGLAMSTMDIIHYAGGKPANFLDVGGSADVKKVAAGFKIILSDPNVKVILVNIFGGIMNCGTIAEGVIAAANELSLRVPLVVRLEGTNVEGGKKLIRESGLAIISADSMADAAEKAVKALR